jgi:peptidoglycan/LPS O-acetylase OafA/YrhL
VRYRSELDGLRALAVLPVVFYHAGIEYFRGGFIGVDVFFVLSGYLITSIILTDLQSNTFSIARFYERRARRILPALFAVLFFSSVMAWFSLLPDELKSFDKSLIAVATFSSNFFFWTSSSYFDPAAELQPLLHTWSLAVEEQYYLVFPILIAIVFLLSNRTQPKLSQSKWKVVQQNFPLWITAGFLLVLAVASFVSAVWLSQSAPRTAFYFLHTRAWELLAGALTAAVLLRGNFKSLNPLFREFASIAGVIAILTAVVMFNKRTAVPGLPALVPVLGAVLIILFANQTTLVGKLLSMRLLVVIGLISYSAYLWHYPLFAIAKHRSVNEPSQGVYGVLILATFLIAYLSWKFLEAPFRDRQRFNSRSIFLMSIGGSIIFIVWGGVGYFANGHPTRLSAEALDLYNTKMDHNPKREQCMSRGGMYLTPEQSCLLGNERNVVGVLLGDSHADAIAGAIELALRDKNLGIKNLSFAGCPPIMDIYRDDEPDYALCSNHNFSLQQTILNNEQIKNVIFIVRWSHYLGEPDFNNGEGGIEKNGHIANIDFIEDGVFLKTPLAERPQRLLQKYVKTIRTYLTAGKNVILVYPIPETGWDVPLASAKQHFFKKVTRDLSTSYSAFQARHEAVIDIFDALGDVKNLTRIKPSRYLCDSQYPGRCITMLDGSPLYFDDDHIAHSKAGFIAEPIVEALID